MEVVNLGDMILSRIQAKGWNSKKQVLGTIDRGQGSTQENDLQVCLCDITFF